MCVYHDACTIYHVDVSYGWIHYTTCRHSTCHVIQCCVMSFHIIWCRIIALRIISRFTVSLHNISSHDMSQHTMSCHVMPCHVRLHCIRWCRSMALQVAEWVLRSAFCLVIQKMVEYEPKQYHTTTSCHSTRAYHVHPAAVRCDMVWHGFRTNIYVCKRATKSSTLCRHILFQCAHVATCCSISTLKLTMGKLALPQLLRHGKVDWETWLLKLTMGKLTMGKFGTSAAIPSRGRMLLSSSRLRRPPHGICKANSYSTGDPPYSTGGPLRGWRPPFVPTPSGGRRATKKTRRFEPAGALCGSISPEFHQNVTGISPELRQKIELEHLKKEDDHNSAFPHPDPVEGH